MRGARIIGLLAALALVGCAATQLDVAVNTSNAARDIGESAVDVLRATCTDYYDHARTVAQLEKLDKFCIPARDALATYRAAWLALVAGIEAVKAGKPDAVALATLMARMVDASRALSAAVGVQR